MYSSVWNTLSPAFYNSFFFSAAAFFMPSKIWSCKSLVSSNTVSQHSATVKACSSNVCICCTQKLDASSNTGIESYTTISNMSVPNLKGTVNNSSLPTVSLASLCNSWMTRLFKLFTRAWSGWMELDSIYCATTTAGSLPPAYSMGGSFLLSSETGMSNRMADENGRNKWRRKTTMAVVVVMVVIF